ncbi:MAG TPA: FAD:protein FMN transferase, partial [Miltoncostaea sp.]|nr:FAD:protein FMN transferase [Miltoncostaea sp.]
AGRPVPAPAVLLDAVEAALAAARATGGAFDPALGVQLRGLGYDRTFDEVGDAPGGPARTAPGGGWRAVRVDRAAGCVTVPVGAELDLGGIAKGMTADAAVALLGDAGARCALVSAGGDLAVLGAPPGRTGWTVAVRTPGGAVPVTLERGALATSGVERRNWMRDGVRRHHIVDPASGLPAETGLWSATAVAGSCAQAEVAATAAFVLGAGAGAALLARLGMPGLMVTPSGATLPVGGWPAAEAA